ncbi:MAG TPA: serine/threonine-protein kinase [Gemmatimonadaceae bacterium]|nr:serine/threonine-protein kinase [Gemmatimonadaceae bacterium]
MTDPVASTPDAELRAHVSRVLGSHYEIEQELGRGGMGIVYCARDKRLKRTVAVKLLPPELAFRSDIRSRFLREAETAAQLSHPNIVPIYAVDEIENLVFFVMAYVAGNNLARELHDKGRLPIPETRRILREVSDALSYAHSRSVIHRDIKPDNILLDRETGRAMVTDFGIARAVSDTDGSRLTATGMAIGTPAYMSPEQAAGEREIDGRSDLYALGVVAYQMLTGAPPFAASSTPAMLVKHLTERPQPVRAKRSDVPEELERIIMVLLEKDPANRLPSATSLVAALDGAPVARPPRTETATAGAGNSMLPPPPPLPAPISGQIGQPSQETLARWYAPEIVGFRNRIRKWAYASLGFFVMGMFIPRFPWLMISGFWAMGIAWRFTGLMGRGYSWRDLLRQPPEREFVDLLGDWVESAQSVFNSEKRMARRLANRDAREARRLARRDAQRGLPPITVRSPLPGQTGARPGMGNAWSPLPNAGRDTGSQAAPRDSALAQAQIDRDEIKRLIDSMPTADRSLVANVVPSADALLDRVRTLSISLADIERNMPQGQLAAVDAEIARLEGEANPLDRARSEERVRRLASLRRQRRALSDLAARRDQMAARIESCALALQSMRFDVLRLRAGAQSHAQVTSLALEALSLAREVDYAVSANDDVARLTGSSARPATDR